MVFNAPKHFTLFKKRRQRFIDNVKIRYGNAPGVIVLSAAFETDRHTFRQESSFYYLTGITEPAAVLFLYMDGREVMYLPRFTVSRDQWVSVSVAGPGDAKRIEVDEIRYLGAATIGYSFRPIFEKEKYADVVVALEAAVASGLKVFTPLDRQNEGYFMHISLVERLQQWIPGLEGCVADVADQLHAVRRVKDEYEIDLIYKAIQITSMAQKAAAAMMSSGKYEYEVQAAIECVFTHVAAARPAFPSIVATGKNTTVLHYTQCSGQLNQGDLVVVDIGAEYGFYAADLTRTYPVNGFFSDRQREVYNIVLETQLYIESVAMPGMYVKNHRYPDRSLHHLAVKFLEQRGYAQYFCHGIGHYLGLDVHDVGDYDVALQPGDVFTIEPGVYIPRENLGVRIEDDYVMADDGALCLSYELPKQPHEIEKMMNE